MSAVGEEVARVLGKFGRFLYEIEAGTLLRAKKTTHFTDGTAHVAGLVYTVKPDEVPYYRVNFKLYELV